MIRLFSHYMSWRLALLIILDALILIFALNAGTAFHLLRGGADVGAAALSPPIALAAVLGMLVIMNSIGLYRVDDLNSLQAVLPRLIAAAAMFVLSVVCLGLYVTPPRNWALDDLSIALLVAMTGSGVVRFAFYRWNRLSTFKTRVLVLGTGSRVMKLMEYATRNDHHVVVGCIALTSSTNHYVPLPRVLPMAPGESLLSIAAKYEVDQIVIAVRDRRGGTLPVQELLKCRLRGINVIELSTFFEREYRQVLLESLNASWMMLGEGFRQGGLRVVAKRLFDLAASTALLILTFPIMVIAAACIFLESGRPLLYRQERVGQGGRIFTIFKLRSMKNDAEKDGKPRWAAANDDRTTRIGRIIRKLRIDELPQIINVLKGEMSFVGPRPERPFFVDTLTAQIPYYALRHSVKPGITGWAQVRYPYGASVDDAIEKLQYDLYYVKNHTLFLDLVILFATVEIVIWGKGAQ